MVKGEKGGNEVKDSGPFALISVSDKRGIVEFARGLIALGFEIIATGGTAKVLEEARLPVIPINEITGIPEIMDGRVKTLSPKILGGILARREKAKDLEEAKQYGIPFIDIVTVNLYPFEKRAREGLPEEELLEEIDIGGVALIRASVKNYRNVIVVTDPDDYKSVIDALSSKAVSTELKKELALKAIRRTANYDSFIYNSLHKIWFPDITPEILFMSRGDPLVLRYGENPHQKGIFYQGEGMKIQSIWGKALSYNNLIDVEAALELLYELGDERPAAVIVKHTSPCGAAVSDSIEDAFEKAWDSDSLSAFGGILALNRPPTLQLVQALNQVFLEVLIAPEFPKGMFEILKKKKNRRLIPYGPFNNLRELLLSQHKFRSLFMGILLQSPDRRVLPLPLFDVDGIPLTEHETSEAIFATKVVKHAKSNAIVVAKNQATLGIGSGMPSRVDAVKLALLKAGEKAKGAVLASDAFFPFKDSIEIAGDSKIKMIVQPGGSRRDEEVIKKAKELGIKMVLTGLRHFKH